MSNTRYNHVLRRQKRMLVQDAVLAATVSAAVVASIATLTQLLK